MLVLSERLTTGQVTFIFRVVVQILSYGGLFLIGLIILGNTPCVAPLETHDTLNRMVGKSTATSTTIHWIKRRTFSKIKDPSPSLHLLIALILSLSYGLFVALSDLGFIGLQACSIPFPSYIDYPASVRSEADARALVRRNVIEGANPADIKSSRCNSVEIVPLNVNQSLRSCTSWSNSTYNDPSAFRLLNLTDTGVLMFRNLGTDREKSARKDLQVYYFGALGLTEQKAKVNSGIAVIPYESGAKMIVGAPDLGRNQTVNIPKTMVVDLSVGCLPLGLLGAENPTITNLDIIQSNSFVPDPRYKLGLRSKYKGPDYLFEPLLTTADEIRQLVLPHYNTSVVLPSGFFEELNSTWTKGRFTWATEVGEWYASIIGSRDYIDIVKACGERIHRSLGITVPRRNDTRSNACTGVVLSGSFSVEGQIFRRYSVMACASATSIKMASAVLNTDHNGLLTANTFDLPSDLHEIKADFWDTIYNTTTNTTTYQKFQSVQRFTLSDNPAGQKNHFILQTDFSSGPYLSRGAASVGYTIPQIGIASMSPTSTITGSATENIINGSFFSCENLTSSMVTTWAGGHAASFFLSSYAMNGFAGLDKDPLTVQSTGGKEAVCYQAPYLAAFVPLLFAAFLIVIWAAYMLATSKLRGIKIWEARYGGLSPTIFAPALTKESPDEILAWEDVGEAPHLRPIHSTITTHNIPSMPNETTELITSQTDKEY